MLAPSLTYLLENAVKTSIAQNEEQVTVEHLLSAMLADDNAAELLRFCGGNIAELRSQLVTCSKTNHTDEPPLLKALVQSDAPGTVLADRVNGLPPDSRDGLSGRNQRNVDYYRDCTKKLMQVAEETLRICEKIRKANSALDWQFAGCLEGSLLRASFWQIAAGQSEVNEAHVLAAMFDEVDSPAVALLKSQSVHKIDVLNYISHRITKEKEQPSQFSEPSPRGFFGLFRRYNVLMHNDHYTTMEFVNSVLMSEFGKNEKEAAALLIQVHQQGKAVVGTYPHEVALSKARLIVSLAQAKEFPLLCTVEPSP